MVFSSLELLPAEEEARLFALSQYDISHSLCEPVFDELVALLPAIFCLPIALVGLVDAEQVSYRGHYETPYYTHCTRQEAVCSLVIRQNRALVFTDLAEPSQCQQLTAAAYASTQAMRLRFYAGTPLRMPDQQVVGTLCVVGRRSRALGLSELYVLEQLAQLIERLIVVRHACRSTQWLEQDCWQLVQSYVMQELRGLRALLSQATRPNQYAVGLDTLRLVISQLNALGAVLAEPLPGFA